MLKWKRCKDDNGNIYYTNPCVKSAKIIKRKNDFVLEDDDLGIICIEDTLYLLRGSTSLYFNDKGDPTTTYKKIRNERETIKNAWKNVTKEEIKAFGIDVNENGLHIIKEGRPLNMNSMSDEMLLAFSLERDMTNHNRYTPIARTAQSVYQKRKGGMHSVAHWERSHGLEKKKYCVR